MSKDQLNQKLKLMVETPGIDLYFITTAAGLCGFVHDYGEQAHRGNMSHRRNMSFLAQLALHVSPPSIGSLLVKILFNLIRKN